MGVLGNAFNGVLKYHRLQIVGNFIYERAIEPMMSKYVDGLNIEEKVQEHIDKRFDASEHTKEELDSYKQAGEDLSKFADNIAKYGSDMEGENTLKAAMLRMAGRLGDVAKDSPVEAGSYLQGNTLVSDQLLNSVRYVNEKVAEAEKDGQIPSSENMLSWGKEGFMQSALQTAADVGGKAVAAAQEQHAAKVNGSDQQYDRVAAAQELEDSLEKPDNGNTVDLDSL